MSAILERLEYAKLHAAYLRTFDSPDGKVVLEHIMKQGYMLRTTFVAGDPNETMLNEGSRRLALSIVKFFGRDHKLLVGLIEEQTNAT